MSSEVESYRGNGEIVLRRNYKPPVMPCCSPLPRILLKIKLNEDLQRLVDELSQGDPILRQHLEAISEDGLRKIGGITRPF